MKKIDYDLSIKLRRYNIISYIVLCICSTPLLYYLALILIIFAFGAYSAFSDYFPKLLFNFLLCSVFVSYFVVIKFVFVPKKPMLLSIVFAALTLLRVANILFLQSGISYLTITLAALHLSQGILLILFLFIRRKAIKLVIYIVLFAALLLNWLFTDFYGMPINFMQAFSAYFTLFGLIDDDVYKNAVLKKFVPEKIKKTGSWFERHKPVV